MPARPGTPRAASPFRCWNSSTARDSLNDLQTTDAGSSAGSSRETRLKPRPARVWRHPPPGKLSPEGWLMRKGLVLGVAATVVGAGAVVAWNASSYAAPGGDLRLVCPHVPNPTAGQQITCVYEGG